MNLTEAVKEVLDRECALKLKQELENKLQRSHKDSWYVSMSFWENHSECDYKANTGKCWQCHVHDALAARIADKVNEVSR